MRRSGNGRRRLPASATPRRRDLVILAACLGIAWGFAEVAIVAFRKYLLHRPVWLGEQLIWMAPLMAGAIAVLTAVVPVVLLWGRSPAVAVRASLFAVSSAAAWSLLIVAAPGFREYGRLLLGLGIGAQFALLLGPRLMTNPRRTRLVVGGLIVLTATLWAGVNPGARVVENIRMARLTVPASPLPPNILLIIFDTERAQSLSLYGNRRPTSPWLERLSQRGVRFERAFATSSWTLPSHGSLFTGREAHELSTAWLTPLDEAYPTLAERLGGAGYATAGFVANTYYCGRDFGLSRGFLHYEDYVASPEELLLSVGLMRRVLNSGTFRRITHLESVLARKRAADVNRAFLGWLDGRRTGGDRPFFAFLNYHDPHEPYAPPPPYDTLFGGGGANAAANHWHKLRDGWLPEDWRRALGRREVQGHQDAYEGTIAYADSQLGDLVEALARRGVLERTLLVVTSDHGEQFREHRRPTDSLPLLTHGNSLYAQALWVPLVIVYPQRVPAGISVETPVSLRDIPATLGALTGAFAPSTFPGRPLSSVWEGGSAEPPSRPVATLVAYDQREGPGGRILSVVVDDHHYIRYESGQIEVFNHRLDPTESRDLRGELVRTPEGRALLDSLARALQVTVGGLTGSQESP